MTTTIPAPTVPTSSRCARSGRQSTEVQPVLAARTVVTPEASLHRFQAAGTPNPGPLRNPSHPRRAGTPARHNRARCPSQGPTPPRRAARSVAKRHPFAFLAHGNSTVIPTQILRLSLTPLASANRAQRGGAGWRNCVVQRLASVTITQNSRHSDCD